MSEAEVKTNTPSAPAAAVAAPKKDPHAEAKKQRVVTPEYMFLEEIGRAHV